MPPREFQQMRASLLTRGLIDAAFRLTPAGHAYCDELLAALRWTRAPVMRGQGVRGW
jgi:hypothetical protein